MPICVKYIPFPGKICFDGHICETKTIYFTMELEMFLQSDADAVFSANGVFLENNSCIKYETRESVYITIFPLSQKLNPYTARLTGSSVTSDCSFCDVYCLSADKFVAHFMPKYNYVYSPNMHVDDDSGGIVAKFFKYVKNQDYKECNRYMTAELASSLSETAINEFFKDYIAVIKDNFFFSNEKDCYLFIDKDKRAHPHTVRLKNNLIDDIEDPSDDK